jgi:phage I-like protein
MSGQKANSTSLHSTSLQATQSLMVVHGTGAEIALNASGGAADWIMLLPIGAGGLVTTVDKRGPYRVTNPAKLATASLQAAGGRLPIDENHSTDLAAPRGEPAPARGWATELDARPDGIYGRVEWSANGAALMSEKAYRFISPVITHDAAGNVLTMPRASLVNTPNLRGMAALNAQETTNMDFLATLIKLLGLPDGSDEAAVVAAIKKEMGDDASTSMQSIAKAAGLAETADRKTVLATVTTLKAGTALQSIAKAAGLKEEADAAAIVTAITALSAGVPDTIKALQSELTTVTTTLTALQTSTAKDKATAFVDGAIREGRVGVKPLRDHYISMHAADPARVEKEIGGMPKLGASGALEIPPARTDGQVALNSEQLTAAKLLGIKPEDYQKTLASEQTAA